LSEDQTAKLLSRIAAMESELATLRAVKPRTDPPFDPEKFRQAFYADPVGMVTKMGVPVDHVTRVLVANALGDQAPPELKVLAAMGPQMSAVQAASAQVEELSRRLSSYEQKEQSAARAQSVKALISDKTKYPHLAKAFAADPSILDDLGGENAEEAAAKMEKRFSLVAPPPASVENADASGQSTQSKPATVGALSGEVPPLPQPKSGVLTQDEDRKLRDEIVRKYSSQQ
jgi:uncharacterized phage infection (PIP) family protein YhgE